MEFTNLFALFANYLNFAIDFVQLRGMREYSALGSVSPTLVSYFVVGVVLAYLVARLDALPGYEQRIPSDPQQLSPSIQTGERSPLEVDTPDMAAFVFLSIVGGILFHGLLLMYGSITGGDIGNVKDTLNAVFAVNAVYNPINAFLKQTQRAMNVAVTWSRGCALLGVVVLTLVTIAYFAMGYYWIYALAAVHGTSKTYMLPPLAPMGLIGLGLGIVLALSKVRSDAVTDSEHADAPS